MSYSITKFVFYAILSVSFVVIVLAPVLATLAPNVDTDFFYGPRGSHRSEQTVRAGSQCTCYVGRTWVGSPVMCIKCPGESDCKTMIDGDKCRDCFLQCHDAACDCIQNCKHMCYLPENAVVRVAIGCGIIMIATAALAFFCKVFLLCCFGSIPVSRPFMHRDTDATSLNSVDLLVAQRLRDAPPRYDSLVTPDSGEPRPRPPPPNVFPPLDKPPPYHALPNRGELCLQVTTLPDLPPPYSTAAFLNAPSLLQAQIPTTPVSVPSPPTPPANHPPANTPLANTPSLPLSEPGRDLCRTFTL